MRKVDGLGIGLIASSIEPLKQNMFPCLRDVELTRVAQTCGYLHTKVLTAEREWRERAAQRNVRLDHNRPAFDQYRNLFPTKEGFRIQCKELPLLPFQFIKSALLFYAELLGKAMRHEAGG